MGMCISKRSILNVFPIRVILKRIVNHCGVNLFEILHFERIRDILLLITFSFLIAEMVA